SANASGLGPAGRAEIRAGTFGGKARRSQAEWPDRHIGSDQRVARHVVDTRALPRRCIWKRSRAGRRSETVTASPPIALSYGRGHLPVEMPAHAQVTIVRKRPLAKIATCA